AVADSVITDLPEINQDSDGDLIADWWEIQHFGDLTTADRDSDYDGDGVSDYYEYLTSFTASPSDPKFADAGLDSDGDGLTNLQEQLLGTMPHLADTDDDGVSDYAEVTAAVPTDPLDSLSPRVYREFRLNADTDHIVLNDPELDLYALDSFTFEAWIKRAAGEGGVILARHPGGEFNYRFEVSAAGRLKLLVNGRNLADTADVDFSQESIADAALQVPAAEWTHVAVSYGSADGINYTARFYVNGADATDPAVAGVAMLPFSEAFGDLPADPGDAVIGAKASTGVKALTGAVFDVRIWSGVRSASEIAASMAGEADASSPALRGWFRFDDGGATVENFAAAYRSEWLSGWAHAGTLVGGAVAESDPSSLPETYIDSDGDLIADWWEYKNFGDLATAGRNSDFDGDGVSDYYEYLTSFTTKPSDPKFADAEKDSDGDGLSNLQEQLLGTMPHLIDTDDDGLSDFAEVTSDPAGNPLDSLNPHVNRELRLAADGHVDLGDLGSLALGEFTIEAWIKPTAAGAILQRRSSAGSRVNYRFEVKSSGRLYLVFNGESFTGEPAGNKKSTSSAEAEVLVPLDGGTWTHVAVQLYRKSAYLMSVRFYVNGVDATAADQADFAIAGAWTGRSTADVRIGSDLAALPTMAGSILDLKVWNSGNVAVASNWDRFEPASMSGLVAWYRFDDGPERTIAPATHPDGDTNTIENFVHGQDWLTGWEHAARLVNGVIAPANMDGLPDIFIDSDNDGIADWWEIQHFGNLDRDGAGDFDGDGLNDLYEFLAGTD
ncbi:MAG TPA: LamG domain-containing protein, partial [Mycobacterium sp.]|nr:LamG domain-containing protein [Mycobacterium sp.]